ncbi:MAG: hypothetical protein WAO83_05965 [Fuerstiella sp.]
MKRLSFSYAFVTLLALMLLTADVVAQSTKYTLQIDVLTEPQPSFQLHARSWGEALQQLEQLATFRQGRNGDKTTIENVEVGRDTVVKVVGILNRDGSISFRGHKFFVTDLEPMKVWLQRLEEFGADGPPSESPTWGLNVSQYTEVLKLLSKTVDEPVNMASPMQAIDSLKLPASFRYQFTDQAKKRAFLKPARIGSHPPDFSGLSKGTSLAIALSQFGLGFRPLANPAGGYFIEIEVGGEGANLYPIGWVNQTPITVAVPALSKSVEVDLVDAELDGLIQLIANKLELRLLYSAAELKAAGRDVSTIKYTRKPGKLSPYSLMRILNQTHKIGMDLRTDEAGTIFLWVTTDDEYKAFKTRFANVRPR